MIGNRVDVASTHTETFQLSTLRRRAAGFTYVELLAAVAVTGIGICAALAGMRAGLTAAHTVSSMELSREFAEAIHQFSLSLEFEDPQGGAGFGPDELFVSDFDDLDDLNGLVQCPPINGDGTVLIDFGSFCQKVTVTSVDGAALTAAAEGSTPMLVVTVTIERGGRTMGIYQWLAAKR